MKIYQIFYNQETKVMLDPKFTPFDNSSPTYRSWHEFEVIKKIEQIGLQIKQADQSPFKYIYHTEWDRNGYSKI